MPASTNLLVIRPVPCQQLGHRLLPAITMLSQVGQERWKHTQRIFKLSLSEAYNFYLGLEVFWLFWFSSLFFFFFFFLGGLGGGGNELSYPEVTSFLAILCMGEVLGAEHVRDIQANRLEGPQDR